MQLDLSDARRSAEFRFWGVVAMAFVAIFILQPNPVVAGFLGFSLAALSAIGNDSMQTLGTFIASNRKSPWWLMGIFISGVLIFVHIRGWVQDEGEISFGRLSKIPYTEPITHIQLMAPLVLLILTRYGIPVSTTFLLISVFSQKAMGEMIETSVLGYVVALVAAFGCWFVFRRLMANRPRNRPYNRKFWRVFQWASTTFLWSTWLMHDTANIAVFLPRHLDGGDLALALVVLVSVVLFVMYLRGGAIQKIVEEKSATDDIRAATMVDLVYAVVLLVFKEYTKVPMSTTWVFLGLLTGRQFAIRLASRPSAGALGSDFRMAVKDLGKATLGAAISAGLVLIGSLLQPSPGS